MASIFFSYCHADEALRNELQKHLSLMVRTGQIETWHDRMIRVGDEFDGEIDQHLEEAEVILLLISSDFMNSDYCYNVEVKRAMERHQQGEARVIPVILRPYEWHEAPFGKLLAAPTDGKPVTQWPNQDEAFVNIVKHIRDALPKPSYVPAENPQPSDSGNAHTAPHIRSSNLSVNKEFSEAEQDRFMDESFKFITKFFDGSLQELERRNAGIETSFKRIDANCFTARIYQNGKAVSKCSICHDDSILGNGITYSNDDTSRGNSFNELITIEVGDQTLSLSPSGMPSMMRGQTKDNLTQQGAAEHFWALLMQRLQ
jgi:hypothetical protein